MNTTACVLTRNGSKFRHGTQRYRHGSDPRHQMPRCSSQQRTTSEADENTWQSSAYLSLIDQADNTLGRTFVGRVGSATKIASLLQNVVGRGHNVSDSSDRESERRLAQHKIRNHCAFHALHDKLAVSSCDTGALLLPYRAFNFAFFTSFVCPDTYSALAGSFAALAGLLGKLGADSDSRALRFVETQCLSSSLSDSCALLSFTARLLCLALMLSANGLMLRCFVKGLHETDSLTATVTSAAVNFVLAAAGGSLFFQEHLSMRWFIGAFMVLSGIALLLYGERSDDRHKKTKRE